MAREAVSDDELARAHALIESSELSALSHMDEVADRLSMYATYFERPELINELDLEQYQPTISPRARRSRTSNSASVISALSIMSRSMRRTLPS